MTKPALPIAPLPPARTPPSIRVARIESHRDLSRLEGVWRWLQVEDPAATAFSTWEWCSAAARHFVPQGALRCLLVQRDGEPAGLVPLALWRHLGLRTLSLLGAGISSYSIADYQDVLALPHQNEAVLAAALDHLAADKGWDQLWLHDLLADSETARNLPDLARRHGWRVSIEPASASYSIVLPDSIAAYQMTLSANNRKALRRRSNKLNEHGGTYYTVLADDDPLPALDTLIDLHTRRWAQDGQPGIFARPAVRAFHRDVVHELHASGMLDLTLLRIPAGNQEQGTRNQASESVSGSGSLTQVPGSRVGGVEGAVAAQYAIDFNGRRHFYINGYDPVERWQALSLGSLLDVNRVADAILNGLEVADFGRGEGEYKQRYTPRTHAKVHIRVFRTDAAYLRLRAFVTLRDTAKRLLGRTEPA